MTHCNRSVAIACNSGERGSPYLTALLHLNSLPALPLSRTEEVAASDPSGRKTFGIQHFKHNSMFQKVESLLKIKFKDNNLSFGMMTLVKIFKSPSQTILNRSSFNETILVIMNNLKSNSLKPISQKFSNNLERGVQERDRPKIINTLRIIFLWDQSNIGRICTLVVSFVEIEIMAELIHIIPDDRPGLFEKDNPSGPGALS